MNVITLRNAATIKDLGMEIVVRKEMKSDERAVEEVTREAFWNLYVPGCNEHYLAHVLRDHRDFIPSLDYVAVLGGHIVGNIMYTRSRVIDENDIPVETITFGPVSVLPEHQRMGIGSRLIWKTIEEARAAGEKAIIIYGSPSNYCKFGFKSCKDYGISTAEGKYPYGLLVLELQEGVFKDHRWRYQDSEAYSADTEKANAFDKTFNHKDKEYRYTQEEFSMSCRACIEDMPLLQSDTGVEALRAQLKMGQIQKGYKNILDYLLYLQSYLKKKYSEYNFPGSFYHGYLDMSYFAFIPPSLKDKNLKIAMVFNYEAFRFEIWLCGYNKRIQKKYWEHFKNRKTECYIIPATIKGYDSILEDHFPEIVAGGLERTAEIEGRIQRFIKHIENTLEPTESL